MTALSSLVELSVSAVVGLLLALLCLQIKPAKSFSPSAAAASAASIATRHTTCRSTRAQYYVASAPYRTSSRVTILRASDDDNDDDDADNESKTPGASSINVLGTKMECCCSDVANTGIGTGFYRNGYCSTGEQDFGRHTVCVKVTSEFLEFSKSVGNDLSTPVPEFMFPGLSEGDVWCLCAQRWYQAWEAAPDLAPKLYLRATHEKTLDYVPYDVLRMYALDGDEADEERRGLDEQRAKLEALLGKAAEEPQKEE
mmetsp:Transcript_31514/g.68142  ORF Transcript_31514/g.68142 Transcript_31514/m.68142 type:complete len:256 (-) Transcript_31514:29-796(-)